MRRVLLTSFALVVSLCQGAGLAQAAVPSAGHVRLDAEVLRLRVNDTLTRWQFKLLVTVTAPEEDQLQGSESAILRVVNPAGRFVDLLPREALSYPKRFKAANAKLQFRATEDSSTRSQSNVPEGFFAEAGDYRFTLALLGKQYSGSFRFGAELQMKASQLVGGQLKDVRNFCLNAEDQLVIETVPAGFGPVYYKRQDVSNFVYQLANIEDALSGGSFHAPVESPSYVFQVRVGDATGETELLDPSRYIKGHQAFLIRSDWTTTPLEFNPHDFGAHKALLIDFSRKDTAEPNAGFSGPEGTGSGWSGQLVVHERVIWALGVETAAADEGSGVWKQAATLAQEAASD